MRRLSLVALTVTVTVVTVLLGGVGAPVAVADCVAPRLSLGVDSDEADPTADPAEVVVGQPVEVTGTLFRNGCDDTGAGPGCRGPADPESPMVDVRLTLHQGQTQWVLDTADAGERADLYPVHWRGTVPHDVAPGAAQLRAGTATLPITITR